MSLPPARLSRSTSSQPTSRRTEGYDRVVQGQSRLYGYLRAGRESPNLWQQHPIWYHALVASQLSFVNPAEAVVYTSDALHELRTRFPRPLDFFARELSRTRPRHYVLFTLEATFLLVSILVDPAESPFAIRDSAFFSYLAGLVHFAESVSGSDIEVDVDNDERYHLKLSWFKTMLDRLSGKARDKSPEPDGSGWPGGWNQFARLLYGFI